MKIKILSFLTVLCLLLFVVSLTQAETILPVKFKAQVPPGNWSDTANCGQASVNMAIAYHQGVTPTTEGIMAIDDWLAQSKWDIPIDDYNSSSTKPWILADVAIYYGGFPNSYWDTGWTLQDLRNSIDQGLPVVCRIVASYLTNRGYGYTGKHYIVAIGYTSTHIVCNDPGSPSGGSKYYSNYDMERAMYAGFQASEDGSVTVVVPGSAPPPPPPDTPPEPPQDLRIPSVSILYPTDGASLRRYSSSVTVKSVASDDVVVKKVQLFVNNRLHSTVNCDTQSYDASFRWAIRYLRGAYSLQAKAIDGSGKTGASPIVKVTVR